MNQDRIEGKVKDITGRIERQAGEWTGDPKKQVEGAAKQIEGKVQNILGKAKDAARKPANSTASSRPHHAEPDSADSDEES